jgi:hypothetical protein
MQDHHTAGDGQASDGTLATVPASVVDCLRRAAYSELGLTAEALDAAAFSTNREEHPERFRGLAENIREIYALLDAIGWTKTDPPPGGQIDLSADGWALVRVLTSALEFAEENTSGPAHGEAERNRQDSVPDRDADPGQVGALCDFIDAAQARIDALAVQEGAEPALDIAA